MFRYVRRGQRPRCVISIVLFVVALCAGSTAWAQLRVVTYNTLRGPNPGLDTVLEAIGEENVGGIARPIDILLLQEQTGPSFDPLQTTDGILNVLNNIYGAGTYARGNLAGGPIFSNSLRQTIVYNSNTVQLVGEVALGTTGVNSQPRQVLRHQVRPLGYNSSADFYIYNSHYKASPENESEANSNLTNGERRDIEAMEIRSNADGLGPGVSAIYAGDFNMRSSFEDAFQTLVAAGNGQANDPVNQLGTWHNNSGFATWHTQSPCEFACSPGFAAGGLDDRFDFQLITDALDDEEGVDFLAGTYRSFGNNGSTYNDAINVGNTITINGLQSFTTAQVLDALESASDHLPVVADYQIPALLNATTGAVPMNLNQGQTFNLDLFVSNAAPVLVQQGADELNYSFTTTGDITGGGSGTHFALDAADTHFISLDTSSEGAKSGSIIVTTTSPGAPNSQITIPIAYQVGEGGGGTPVTIARAVFPNVADDLNVTGFQFGGAFTTEDTDTNSGGTLPVGSDARTLAFTSPGDMFGIEDRQDDSPFAVLDDTLAGFPGDQLGIIKATDFDNFFGVSDTENGDNAGPLTAEWTFDISAATGGLELSIDMAAMGDFEDPEDVFQFEISLDGAPFVTAFTAVAEEALTQDYTLESGTLVSDLVDPLSVDGVLLSNEFQTFTELIGGTGSELTLRFTSETNGTEAFAFRNIVIMGLTSAGLPGDFNDDGVVNAADYAVWRDNLGAADEGTLNGNGDGMNGVDQADYELWVANFGMAAGAAGGESPTPAPEPSGALLLMVACLVGAIRRIG